MNPNTMTAAECADWCAEDDGWVRVDVLGISPAWQHTDGRVNVHPHPLTLDGAARALPEWCSCDVAVRKSVVMAHGWKCGHLTQDNLIIVNGPDELTARYRLAVLCRIAGKEAAK